MRIVGRRCGQVACRITEDGLYLGDLECLDFRRVLDDAERIDPAVADGQPMGHNDGICKSPRQFRDPLLAPAEVVKRHAGKTQARLPSAANIQQPARQPTRPMLRLTASAEGMTLTTGPVPVQDQAQRRGRRSVSAELQARE
ncbi:hypothetical protein AAL_02059 [Moelleriella libera RCEF 2490]|uniref:Uncharacterized protein n=1 Tax=Moelleriella libera RCEF 2490 TaxID=1081109 RepID=A0A168F576_9HYPO|nr:hypothetical protein AAL_02059 [Moelleriella libera RCEF 2490]